MGKAPNLTEKLASAPLMLTNGHGEPLIDREAKAMSAEQIVGLFEFDHGIHRAIKGTNHPTNPDATHLRGAPGDGEDRRSADREDEAACMSQ